MGLKLKIKPSNNTLVTIRIGVYNKKHKKREPLWLSLIFNYFLRKVFLSQ